MMLLSWLSCHCLWPALLQPVACCCCCCPALLLLLLSRLKFQTANCNCQQFRGYQWSSIKRQLLLNAAAGGCLCCCCSLPVLLLLLPPSVAAVAVAAVSNFMQDAIAQAGSTPQHDVARREAAAGRAEQKEREERQEREV